MRFAVNFFEPFNSDMGVYLGGAQIFVSEQLLHAAQIGAGIEQVGRKAVAQFMRSKVRRKSGKYQIIFEITLETSCGDTLSETVEKERLIRSETYSAAAAEAAVAGDGVEGLFAQNSEPLFFPFAADLYGKCIA